MSNDQHRLGDGNEWLRALDIDLFRQNGPDDVVRVDHLSQKVLFLFYQSLVNGGMTGDEATVFANGADYFVRDFVVDYVGENPLAIEPSLVRKFGGTWYILNSLEPDIGQLTAHLQGIKAFYAFLGANELMSEEQYRAIMEECDDVSFYAYRIDSFWAITGDGYLEWERECSLKSR